MNQNNIKIGKILAGLMVALFLSALDNTIVGTAMPRIISDLNALAYYSLPLSVYLLFSAAFVPVAGKLSDVFGRKKIMLWGLALFVAASMLCGFSQSMAMFVICRAVQGASGGVIASSTFIIVSHLAEPSKRGKYIGILATMYGLASITGPLLGGVITAMLSWHWVFYINLPVGAAAFILIGAHAPALKPGSSSKFDMVGVVYFLAAFIPLLALFAETGRHITWGSKTMIALSVFSLLMFIVFIINEKRSVSPLLPSGLLRNRLFALSAVGAFCAYGALFGVVVYVPYLVQIVQHKGVMISGLLMIPMSLGMTAGSIAGGTIVSKSMRYKAVGVTGFLLTAGTLALCAILGYSVTGALLIPLLLFAGFGISMTFGVYNLAPQAAYPQSYLGIIVSTIEFIQITGGVVASSVAGNLIGRDPVRALYLCIAFLLAGAVSMALLNDRVIAEGLRRHFAHRAD